MMTDFLPAPFAWIDIPGKGYSIAKYPITNAQFLKFVEGDGYNQKKWWTDEGWSYRKKFKLSEPPHWKDARYNGDEQPIVGVSWYESVAFCLWLSDLTGEKIMLPTEEQWQYAAQGDDGRIYPWGNDWDCRRCNNSVKPCESSTTTPVNQFEGKGDSFFGVVDMAGNVWEWCLTDYDNKTNDVNSVANLRVQHGGCCFDCNLNLFPCNLSKWNDPRFGCLFCGFRISRS